MITEMLAARSRKAWAVAGAGAALAMALGPAPAAAQAAAHAAASAPPGREWAAFAYYPPRHELVLFGGRRPGTVFGDTWTRTGATWAHQHPATAPSARTGAAMVYDPASRQVVLFGGDGGGGKPFLNGTWTWTGRNWSRLSAAASPPGRAYGTLTYDAADQRVVLFAGSEQALQVFPSTIWSWNGSTWARGT